MPLRDASSDGKTHDVASRQLLAAAAHELKNPMQAMSNLLYVMQQDPTLDDAALNHVSLLRQELERMQVIVAQTLGLYRGSARHEAVQVSDVLDAIIAFYDHKARYKEITVQKKYMCAGAIEAVASEIRQVFTNLVVNALEAVPRGGKVILHTCAWRDWSAPSRRGVRVTIADNGCGIRPDQRPMLYMPSFTTKGDKGNGLGLWVSKGIVEKIGGCIRIRSSAKRGKSGTVFSVFLPA